MANPSGIFEAVPGNIVPKKYKLSFNQTHGGVVNVRYIVRAQHGSIDGLFADTFFGRTIIATKQFTDKKNLFNSIEQRTSVMEYLFIFIFHVNVCLRFISFFFKLQINKILN